MPLKLVRPTLSEDKRSGLQEYLFTQWGRAKEGRTSQVDDQYKKWSDAYTGTPAEEVRTVPFYKASNFVVKLIRIYLDTFVARTLNIMFATKPLYIVDGLDKKYKDDFELYLNRKALYDWQHYRVGRDLCFRGNKNGTVIFKIPYVEKSTIDVMPGEGENSFTEEEVTYYRGPEALPIPFEDFYVYPITINRLQDAEIKFHRTRYTKEAAERNVASSEWHLPEDKDLETYLHKPTDIKRESTATAAGVTDSYTTELHIIEAYLEYPVMEDGIKYYDCIVLFEETTGDIFDLYFNPYPRNLSIFIDYRPFPREDFFYGESLCQILGQSQEEASRIHNERRDNSTIASSVVFKRRNGSLLPNPSTNWYPGKVWDLDDMDDLEVMTVGRNYEDMIVQEDYTFNYADRLSGIGEVMQGAASGGMNKRGIYNTSGTLAVMAEGNQRQDTNIRDVREAMSGIALTSTRLQAAFDPADPLIDTLPESARKGVRDALSFIASDAAKYLRLEVKSSHAGANSEIKKQNLTTVQQFLSQHAALIQQMGMQLLNKDIAPGLRMMMNDIVHMQTEMTKNLLKAYDEMDLIDDLPNLPAAIESTIPGGSRGSQTPGGPSGSQPLLPRATQAPQGGTQGGLLGALAGQIPGGQGTVSNGSGMVPSNFPG